MEDVFRVMLPQSHPLAGRGSVTLADLRAERWAVDTASATYTRMLAEACHGARFAPNMSPGAGGSR